MTYQEAGSWEMVGGGGWAKLELEIHSQHALLAYWMILKLFDLCNFLGIEKSIKTVVTDQEIILFRFCR